MTQTQNRLFDDLSKLMNDMAGVADSAKREVETAFRAQAERFVSEMDLTKREDLEIVRELAMKALAENAELKARIEALEGKADKGKAGK